MKKTQERKLSWGTLSPSMSNGSDAAPGQTAEHRSSFANLVQKKTKIAPAALVQHQKALGSTTTSVQDFAEKYAIASDNVVAAILNDANIKVEAGVEFDKSEQFMDWLRCIETEDERCIQFLVKASLTFQPYPSFVHKLIPKTVLTDFLSRCRC